MSEVLMLRRLSDPNTIKWSFGKIKPTTPHVFTPLPDDSQTCRHCGASALAGPGHWRRPVTLEEGVQALNDGQPFR